MIITNAKIVMRNSVIDKGAVEFDDRGIITRIFNAPLFCDNCIDAGNAILMPGFIDIHVHGSAGIDFMDATAADYDIISVSLYEEGVTTYLATTLTADRESLKRVACVAKEAREKNPSFGGIHLEGPYINAKYKGAQNEAFIRNADWNEICELQKLSGGNIRLITLAPEKEGAPDFIRQATENGIVCSAGHTDASFSDIQKAVGFGLTNITHTHNAMSPYHHRSPGTVTAAMYFDELNCELIGDGIHVSPETVKTFYKIVGEDRLILITDALKIKNSEEKEFRLCGLDCVRRDGAAYLTGGPLAGSLLTMEKGVQNLYAWLKLPLTSLAKISASNAARALGFTDRGEIAEGKLADFVLLDSDLKVLSVYKNGRKMK